MVCAALLAKLPTIWTAVGAVCFAMSDSIIAIGRFILGNEALAVPIWWLYAAAEILITAGFFFGRDGVRHSRRKRESRARRKYCLATYSVGRAERTPVEVEPIARVLPMLSVPHLDREFDYLVSAEQSDDAQPGVRVRVRFHGGWSTGSSWSAATTPITPASWAGLIASCRAEPVLTTEIRRLVDAVAARYAGTRPDVLRLAVPRPPRPGRARNRGDPFAARRSTVAPVDPSGWEVYGRRRGQFLAALAESRAARAVWQALPGELVGGPIRRGRGADCAVRGARRWRSCPTSGTWTRCGGPRPPGSTNTAWWHSRPGLGPAARYRRWLAALRGSARLVIGTRSAVFAPLSDLGLVMVWADADDTLVEPRAPYPHAREVAMLRAHQARCAALIGGYSRTAEAQALVRSGWAHDVVAPRPVVRARTPRVVALDDSGYAEERDPAARTARLPSIALRAARSALEAEAPVLVQVPRRGYVPSLACGRCRAIARCRHCTGPLSKQERGSGCGVPLVWPRRADAAVHALRVGCGTRRRRRGRAHRRRARPGLPRYACGHLGGRRHRDGGSPPVRPWWSPPRGPNRTRQAATARRCCWIPGRCWAGKTCARPRTPCGAG